MHKLTGLGMGTRIHVSSTGGGIAFIESALHNGQFRRGCIFGCREHLGKEENQKTGECQLMQNLMILYNRVGLTYTYP
jgi:hypothetical protein